jgi:prepilin-type N-terminal cleavage/methylation domain-containing protein
MSRRVSRKHAFSLIELMCVTAIILILVSMMMPAMWKALRKARGLTEHLGGGPTVLEVRGDEVSRKYASYRAAHPNHEKLNRNSFIRELHLSAATEEWLKLRSVEYRPFAANDPPEQPVIIVYPSSGGGSGEVLAVFTIAHLLGR